MLRTEAQAGGLQVSTMNMPGDFPGSRDQDFQVAELRIGYGDRRSLFLLVAIPLEIVMEPGQEPAALLDEEKAVLLLFTQQQAQALTSAVPAIVPRGLPVCPLCGAPLDSGPLACVRQNGHRESV